MPDKPLECSQCKKCTDIIYTEMVGRSHITTEMCRSCPVLNRKLNGKTPEESPLPRGESRSCHQCHTPLEAIERGEHLGCEECYVVFQKALIDQLIARRQISPELAERAAETQRGLHTGKTPFLATSRETLSRIQDLRAALHKALAGENYEEAAWLRDRLNSLSEKSDESH